MLIFFGLEYYCILFKINETYYKLLLIIIKIDMFVFIIVIIYNLRF